MWRPMRRSKQSLTHERCEEVLRQNTGGVLSLLGDDGYPYGVPMSYAYHDNKLYFHAALTGHKMDALRSHEKASFTVIDADDIIPEKLTSAYRSVICFGKIRELDGEEKTAALRAIGEKYSSEYPEQIEREIITDFERTSVIELEIEHMTGKRGKESTP